MARMFATRVGIRPPVAVNPASTPGDGTRPGRFTFHGTDQSPGFLRVQAPKILVQLLRAGASSRMPKQDCSARVAGVQKPVPGYLSLFSPKKPIINSCCRASRLDRRYAVQPRGQDLWPLQL